MFVGSRRQPLPRQVSLLGMALPSSHPSDRQTPAANLACAPPAARHGRISSPHVILPVRSALPGSHPIAQSPSALFSRALTPPLDRPATPLVVSRHRTANLSVRRTQNPLRPPDYAVPRLCRDANEYVFPSSSVTVARANPCTIVAPTSRY